MPYTDDPLSDYARWETEQERRLAKLPVCEYCGEPVQDDHYFLINDEVLCRECLHSQYRKSIDEYIG